MRQIYSLQNLVSKNVAAKKVEIIPKVFNFFLSRLLPSAIFLWYYPCITIILRVLKIVIK